MAEPIPVTKSEILAVARMYASDMSMMQIARVAGMSYMRVRKIFAEGGIKARPASTLTAVGRAIKSEVSIRTHKGKKLSVATRAKIRAARLAMPSRGVRITSEGYVEYTTGLHKGRLAHVVLMEKKIGRRLRKHEVVHHVDENRSNNKIGNLRLMTRSAHTALHRRMQHGRRS